MKPLASQTLSVDCLEPTTSGAPGIDETLMRETLDHMEQGVVLYRRDGDGRERVAFFNAWAERFLELPSGMLVVGLPRETIIDLCMRRDDHPRGFDVARHLSRISAGEEVEVIGRRPSGRWVCSRSKPRVTEPGSLTLYIDITEQVQANESLEASRSAYRAMAETAPIGFVKLNANGQITFANSAALDLLGADCFFIHLGDRLVLSDGRNFADAMAGNERFEASLETRSGVRHLLVSLSPWTAVGRERERMIALTDISALKDARMQIEHLAHHDPLTDLGNRSLFNAMWASLVETSGGYLETGILMALDLDHFKRINDEHGHAVGDKLLRAVAARIHSACGVVGKAFRLGGDEFAIICRDIDGHQARRIAAALIKTLSEPFVIDDMLLSIGCSIGLASMPRDGLSIEQVQRAADVALYNVKRNGRNAYAVYDPEQERATDDLRRLETDLASAIAKEELGLLYERRVDLSTGRTTALEAHLHWHNRRLDQTIDPQVIRRLSAKTGLVVPIETFMLSAAEAELGQMFSAGIDCPVLSVRLSGDTIVTPGAIRILRKLRTANSPEGFKIEIAIGEKELDDRSDAIRSTLSLFNQPGVRIAIDRFGERGLAAIRAIPIDWVKLDPMLLKAFEQDPVSRHILIAIAQMCARLGVGVTASCVESPTQIETLRRLGFKDAQGRPFGRPRSAAAMLSHRHSTRKAGAARRSTTAV